MGYVKRVLGCGLAACALYVVPNRVDAQAGLRESLERLDVNENGYIDPDEITPLARPFLEKISRSSRASVDRPTEVHVYQEAARVYHALQNGVAGMRVRVEAEPTVKPFGKKYDEPLIPGFGLPKIKFPYTEADLEEADRTLRNYDRDDDGYLNSEEARRARWTHRDPFEDDVDNDSRLSRLELAQRYARRRQVSEDSGELWRRAVRTGGEIRRSTTSQSRSSNQWYRQGGEAVGLAFSLMQRYDRNRDGSLDDNEVTALGMPVTQLDLDGDGRIPAEELFAALNAMKEALGDVVDGLPSWFYERDENKDGQVSLKEFATEWSTAQLEEFAAIDLNRDGLITDAEVMKSKSAVGGTFKNETPEVLAARRTIVSEIEVDEDFPIGKLKIRLAITHSTVENLDAYLTGPDGTRVELFTQVGGRGNNFEQTIFDDASPVSITKGKPPYTGTFRPEAVDKKQPGLKSFSGTSAKGVWQLIIRATRSERMGLLHYWSLDIETNESEPGGSVLSTAAEPSGEKSEKSGEPPPESKEERSSEERSGEERSGEERSRRSRFSGRFSR